MANEASISMASKAKVSRKLRKCIQQLKRNDPEVEVSDTPTKVLLVGNSSVLCGVSFDELEEIFTAYERDCEFVVFPSIRTYSFVIYHTIDAAVHAHNELHGRKPPLKTANSSCFYICYVKALPTVKAKDSLYKPHGLRLLDNFISVDEEKALLDVVEQRLHSEKKLKSRKVIHFGYEFDYDRNDAFKRSVNDMPSVCEPIIERMMEAKLFSARPDQLTVNIYDPGNGIPSHVDTHSAFGDTIACLSLLSDLVMEFRDIANTSDVYDVLLLRFSLAVMQGESRYRWKHGIAKRKHDIDPASNKLMRRRLRISFTFRKIAIEKCHCDFIEYCDWDRDGLMRIPNSEEQGLRIENEYVFNMYESIACHFDTTRHAKWNGVATFLNVLDEGAVLFDIGCGNGKYLKHDDSLIKIGSDSSEKLCEIVSVKGCQVVRSNVLFLPFKSSSADAAICIAVLHHLSTLKRRLRAIKEIIRVLKPGGRACITVWSYEQKADNTESEYLKMRDKKSIVKMNRRASNGRLRVHEGKDFTQQDMLVPFQNDDGRRFLRYYHLFVAGELDDLVDKVGGCRPEKSFYEKGNWIIHLIKC